MPTWLTFVAGLLGGGLGGSLITWGLGLWRDKLQADRQRADEIDHERREELRALNRQKGERVRGLYAEFLTLGTTYVDRGLDRPSGTEDRLLEIYYQLTIEPGIDDFAEAVEAFFRALRSDADAERSAAEARGAYATQREALSRLREAAREHLDKLDQPVT